MVWTEEEYAALLDAIEKGGLVNYTIEIAIRTTNRSPASIERKLRKMGYLGRSGRSFASKQGFVRR